MNAQIQARTIVQNREATDFFDNSLSIHLIDVVS